MLVGVGEYTSTLIPRLKGPANDLLAMESLLKTEGATDIVVLRDAGATRTTIETAIHDLGKRSKSGDWIVIYFSGHGAQAKAAVTGDEDDDLDEFLVLSGFDPAKPDPENYIVDNDFYAWLARYVPTDVEVLHIADACHSGTLNRSIDMSAWHFTPRLALTRSTSPLVLTARPGPKFEGVLGATQQARSLAPGVEEQDLPNVIFIGAAQDSQLALEASLPAEGAPSRGLLTYAFEQALTTLGPDDKTLAADTNADGAISVAEVATYIDSQTRTMTGQRQQPTTKFAAGGDVQPLFKARLVKPAPPPGPITPPRPGVFAADAPAAAILKDSPLWRTVARPDQADFIWHVGSGSVLKRSGDIVAEQVTTLTALNGVIEKWAVIEQLRPFMAEAAMKVVIGPAVNGARYPAGSRVEIGLNVKPSTAAQYVTVFDLAADGQVQRLYPLAEDGEGKLVGGANALQVLKTEVITPYGADHVIALATTERPDDFRRLLATLEGQRAAPQLASALKAALVKAGPGAALSIGEIYTGKQ